MSRLQLVCPIENCNAVAELSGTVNFWNGNEQSPEIWSKLETYKCGHIHYREHTEAISTEVLRTTVYTSLNGEKQTRHYQVEGLRFIEESDFNCMVADQQGLGKTIEAILALRENKQKLTPTLVIVKSATLWQWQREIKEWGNSLPNGVWMIRSGKDWIPPGFEIYLISMDTLRSFVHVTGTTQRIEYGKYKTTSRTNFKVDDRLAAIGFKCVVADEVHSFKNSDSRRSQSLVELIKLLDIKHKIFLSGTPIMNRASEYFIPLNLLDPLHFPSEEKFWNNWLTDDGKRIRPYYLEDFKEATKGLIIRRERNQVLTDLPPFQRVFEDVVIENEVLKKQINREIEEMKRKDAEFGRELNYRDIADNLMVMRRIIGKAKAEIILDFVHEFMDQTENEKLVIGVHHQEVRDFLLTQLSAYRPLSLSGQDSADRKQALVDAFRRPERRLMIANVIAGGTGLNLQFANNCIMLERQWNSAMEEQFEDRFNRIGQTLPVTAMYPKLLKTIDEWFSNMVEEKRGIFGETVALDLEEWMTNGQVREMVDWIFAQGKL